MFNFCFSQGIKNRGTGNSCQDNLDISEVDVRKPETGIDELMLAIDDLVDSLNNYDNLGFLTFNVAEKLSFNLLISNL